MTDAAIDVRARFLDGFVWLTAGGGAQQLISLLIFLFLARYLAPEDFGVIAFAAVFIDVLVLAICVGQIDVVQQRPELSDTTASTSFWMIQVLALAATAGVVLAAPALESAMHMQHLATALILLCPIVLITSLGQIHEGKLRREMRFRPLAIRNVAAVSASGVAAIGTVMAGETLYALIAQRIVYALVMTGSLWIVNPWRPKIAFAFAEARSVAKTGFHIMSTNISAQLNTRIIDLAVGIFLGAWWLGQMKIAWRIFEFMLQVAILPIHNMALSLFARAPTPEAMAGRFLTVLKVLFLVSAPVFLGFALIAPELIAFALGEKWAPAVPLVQVLCLLSLAANVNYLYGPFLIALGRSGQVMAMGLAQNATTAAVAFATVGFGAVALLAAHAARAGVLAIVNLVLIKRAASVSFGQMAGAILPPCIACIAMAMTVFLVRAELGDGARHDIALAVCVAAGGAAYFGTLIAGDYLRLWPGFLRNLLDMRRGALNPAALKSHPEV